MEQKIVIAITTYSNEDSAVACSRNLIQKKLVACAQVSGPIRSFYQWESKILEDQEWRLVLKFSGSNERVVREEVMKSHEYDSPQWIYWDADTNESYGKWVNAEG